MNYAHTAGEVLFGEKVLDNAARGLFIEALALNALRRRDVESGHQLRWRNTGAGWGPWDLQRGTASEGSRVRVQVKTKAAKQLWTAEKARQPSFKLGLRKVNKLPRYFSRDFPVDIYGECELEGYRADLMLLAWHEADDQSDPHQYEFYIVPVRSLLSAPGGAPKQISTAALIAAHTPVHFSQLADALDHAADKFLLESK